MSEKSYFDLHITGLGYVNRIREVRPRRGEPFLACDIVAIHGDAEDPERTRFDCRVAGQEARRLVEAMPRHLELGRKVLVGFKLGDLYAESFTYREGEKAGETGISLKARLLRIDWVRIDGEKVYPPVEARNQETA